MYDSYNNAEGSEKIFVVGGRKTGILLEQSRAAVLVVLSADTCNCSSFGIGALPTGFVDSIDKCFEHWCTLLENGVGAGPIERCANSRCNEIANRGRAPCQSYQLMLQLSSERPEASSNGPATDSLVLIRGKPLQAASTGGQLRRRHGSWIGGVSFSRQPLTRPQGKRQSKALHSQGVLSR